jgi:hypothetical protein
MARLKFIHGTFVGRLGEFVGSTWKGINYIKTFTKPANPNTPAQASVRLVFQLVSAWASALYSNGLQSIIPSAKKMSVRNSIIKANKAMFTEGQFTAEALQICKANFSPVTSFPGNARFENSNGNGYVTFSGKVGFKHDPANPLWCCLFLYSTIDNLIVGIDRFTVPASGDLDWVIDMFPNFSPDSAVGFAVFYSSGVDGKQKLVSVTHNIPVVINP